MNCDYCHDKARLVTGEAIYPHLPHLHDAYFWQCLPCGAYVGCHRGTITPLGRLANTELRLAKIAAHAVFDPLWRSRVMTRSAAYAWLARELGVERGDCHIGRFDLETCRMVVRVCKERTSQVQDREVMGK